MWKIVIFVIFVPWLMAQKQRSSRQSDDSHGWDIRLAVPGEPGNDYPTLGAIPRTSFTCAGKQPGYYADIETNCQVFRVCTAGSTYGFQSFLCPNGTLFNQAVFVCDWWMNVNCDRSQELFPNNNEKFGNLRLGPQLMQDIKKMLTHPMRNPYDRSTMRSNLIVMQEYKPPAGQMLPSGALMALPDRSNSAYFSAKQIQSIDQNGYDSGFAASSPSPTYVPPFNTINTQGDTEVFQRQRQNSQYTKQAHADHFVSNGQNGQNIQTQNGVRSNGNLVTQPTQAYNYAQFNQRQVNFESEPFESQKEFSNNQNTINFESEPFESQKEFSNNQNTQLNNGQAQFNQGKYNEFVVSYMKQQYNANQSKAAKQNVFPQHGYSAPIIKKTLTFNTIVQDPKSGSPKSRVTFKTWIAKPSKAAKLIANDPTAYSYNRPTQPPTQNLVEQPYIYNPPSTTAQTERIVQQDFGYAYSKPTISSKQVLTTPRLYLTPTLPPPTLSRLYLTPTNPPRPPTPASKLYLAPTTYKPAKIFIPTTQDPIIISRQYLTPNRIQQPSYAQSEKLQASPTSPTPAFTSLSTKLFNNPSFSLTKHSRINANHNNLTFADILTKEKLDITVNDIVSDTSKILKTAAPQYEQYREDKTEDYSEDYLPPQNSESDEKLTPESPTLAPNAKLVSTLATDLEPPFDTYTNNNMHTTNKFANLPFYKEPATNTIERTVSLKISIPEKVASYLFRNQNESNYDKLEILNTGSSNYLVLTNNLLAKNTGASFIPIGKLIADKSSNLSSQALVFSLLADSLNVAKEYNNIAQKNIISSQPQSQQFQQQVNNKGISEFTNRISQLTASHYSNNNNLNPANSVSSTQTTTTSDQYRPAKYTVNSESQHQQIQRNQINSLTQNSHGLPAKIQSNFNSNLQTDNQIYSGQLYQLPVPVVTNQIYNADPRVVHNSRLQSTPNQIQNQNNVMKQTSGEEIVHLRTLPQPAKLQAAPQSIEEFSNQENDQAFNILDNSNGITAQINDKIVGTIPHASENRLVTYKKDQSYFVYSKINNNPNIIQNNDQLNNFGVQSAKIVQNAVEPNVVSFQLVPSISYQLENEKDKQALLNAFNIDEFGNPKHLNTNQRVTSNINNSANQFSAKQINGQINKNLYTGPSSYSAPQASIGSLEVKDHNDQNSNTNARLNNSPSARIEELNGNDGYSKVNPARQFQY